jgi:cytochrome c oxidase subunit 4
MKSEHILSVKFYAAIFGILLVLTLSTAGIAFIDLGGAWNAVAAIAIAVGKALLVVLYFMHARYSSRLTWVFAAAGVLWLMILIGGTINDVLTRESVALLPLS